MPPVNTRQSYYSWQDCYRGLRISPASVESAARSAAMHRHYGLRERQQAIGNAAPAEHRRAARGSPGQVAQRTTMTRWTKKTHWTTKTHWTNKDTFERQRHIAPTKTHLNDKDTPNREDTLAFHFY
jgi:hypothetical protein